MKPLPLNAPEDGVRSPIPGHAPAQAGCVNPDRYFNAGPGRALSLIWSLVFGLLIFLSGNMGWAQAQTVDVRDYSLVQQVPRAEVDAWLKEEIRRSRGDVERQRYHFVVGFSTGHFNTDPVHAIAMRRLAFSLLNNTLASGDRVTPVAWEMRVWNVGQTIPLADDSDSRKAFVDAVPYAPVAGSRGGHDVERALYDMLTRVVPKGEEQSTILLLLTNSNQSQSPTGSRETLFGADNKQLIQAMNRGGFRAPPSRHSFTLRTKDRALTVDVTALFPKQIESLPNAPTTPRYPTFARETWQPPADRPAAGETLPNPVAKVQGPGTGPAAPPQEGKRGFPPALLILVAVLVMGAAIFLMTRKPKPAPATEQAEKPEPRPAGRPLPGVVKGSIGAQELELQPLTTASKWALVRSGEAVTLQDLQEPAEPPAPDTEHRTPTPEGMVLANLSFDERGRLRVEAAGDAQFVEIQPATLKDSSNRLLSLAPGERMFCRIVSAGSSAKVRFELHYQRSA